LYHQLDSLDIHLMTGGARSTDDWSIVSYGGSCKHSGMTIASLQAAVSFLFVRRISFMPNGGWCCDLGMQLMRLQVLLVLGWK
jgi:hypothetical protein